MELYNKMKNKKRGIGKTNLVIICVLAIVIIGGFIAINFDGLVGNAPFSVSRTKYPTTTATTTAAPTIELIAAPTIESTAATAITTATTAAAVAAATAASDSATTTRVRTSASTKSIKMTAKTSASAPPCDSEHVNEIWKVDNTHYRKCISVSNNYDPVKYRWDPDSDGPPPLEIECPANKVVNTKYNDLLFQYKIGSQYVTNLECVWIVKASCDPTDLHANCLGSNKWIYCYHGFWKFLHFGSYFTESSPCGASSTSICSAESIPGGFDVDHAKCYNCLESKVSVDGKKIIVFHGFGSLPLAQLGQTVCRTYSTTQGPDGGKFICKVSGWTWDHRCPSGECEDDGIGLNCTR